MDATKMISIDKLCGAKRRTIDPRDYLYEDAKPIMPKLPAAASTKDGFPKVYCQHYGDCTANAALAADDFYYHAPKKGTWIPSTVFTYYNCKEKNKDLKADDGSCVEFALKDIRRHGACSAKVWPNDKPWNEKPSKEAYDNGLKGREITNFYRIKNFQQLKQAIAEGYPCPGCIEWAFDYYDDDFVLNNPTKADIKKYADRWHAVVFVGYDDKTRLVEIRNSWGEDWCNDGYGYITYETFLKIVDWSDTYAVIK